MFIHMVILIQTGSDIVPLVIHCGADLQPVQYHADAGRDARPTPTWLVLGQSEHSSLDVIRLEAIGGRSAGTVLVLPVRVGDTLCSVVSVSKTTLLITLLLVQTLHTYNAFCHQLICCKVKDVLAYCITVSWRAATTFLGKSIRETRWSRCPGG